ncbi:MAG: RnfABCDGE type electron transport complex subunit C [Candidatus Omnitrophica bacterium]|nr:RnfABCDGE type electron transport complex subunit C [Candidatus Omnitrophota bacterium]
MRGGLRLNAKKESTLIAWTIARPRSPQKVRIPLMAANMPAATALVKVGDRVRLGEKIARPDHPDGVAVHASLSGEITAIRSFSHPIRKTSPAIEITNDGRDEIVETGASKPNWEKLSREEMFSLFQDSGIVDLGESNVPVHVKIRKALEGGGKIHTLILNGCESEPYLSSDHALMMSHPVEILKGAEVLRHILGAAQVLIALEDNKLEPAELLKSKIYFLKWKNFDTTILPTCYPQEDESWLVPSVLLNHSLQPSDNTLVFSVATAFAVYEAVFLQKPFYEKALTVGGECVIEPKNIWVRIGTSFSDCVKNARGLLREPGRVIMGGPMRGVAQSSLEIPVTAGTRAILALPKELIEERNAADIEPCIRCGRCLEVCPAEISPAQITLAVEKNLFEFIEEEDVKLCTECGLCSYVCPAHRPMTELMREAKTNKQIETRSFNLMGDKYES